MDIPLKSQHLRHYRDIAWLLIKYGRTDIGKDTDLISLASDQTDE